MYISKIQSIIQLLQYKLKQDKREQHKHKKFEPRVIKLLRAVNKPYLKAGFYILVK